MLNIYRVISLSLVMSLFFAAPLLCIHPVSYQLRNKQKLAAENHQAKRVKVASQRHSYDPHLRATEALARSLYRSENVSKALSPEPVVVPAAFVSEETQNWQGEQQDWEGAGPTAGFGGGGAVSEKSIYY